MGERHIPAATDDLPSGDGGQRVAVIKESLWRRWRRLTRLLTARQLLALILLGQAFGYGALVWMDVRRTTSYQIQEAIMPLWIYAAALASVALALLWTGGRRRRTALGRSVASVAFALLFLTGVSWLLAGAWTAVGVYAAYLIGLYAEAAHIDDEGC